MEPLKVWILSYLEKKSRALLFPVNFMYFFLVKKDFCVVLRIMCWHGVSVARRKASPSCSILCIIYLKRRISSNICFYFRLYLIKFDFWAKVFLLIRKWWVYKNGLFGLLEWKEVVVHPSSSRKKSSPRKWENAWIVGSLLCLISP